MKKPSILVAIMFLLSALPSCVGNKLTPLPTADADSISTIVAATLTAIPSATPEPSLTLETSVITKPSIQPEDWVSYTHDKPWDSLQGFILYYPKYWLLTTQTDTLGEGNPQMILTLKKNQFVIEIVQGAGSVPGCLYPEDPQIDGFFSRYGEYTDINKGNGIVWRRAMPEGWCDNCMYYVVCELSPETGYGNPFTKIGLIKLQGSTPDELILNEFDEILKRIEILE